LFDHLQISDGRERWMVGAADLLLSAATAPVRLLRRRSADASPGRILLLRLERIGDLLMALPAIAAVRELAPRARIDLVVGSWNEPIARLLDAVDHVELLDAPWLARGGPAAAHAELVRRARAWRRRYDLAINFEGDIRSHLLMWLSGTPHRAGFEMAGGGPVLTDVEPYDPSRHVADNLLRLVERAFGRPAHSLPMREVRLAVPESARRNAEALLPTSDKLLVGVNVGGGREIKQWEPARFGVVAARLSAKYGARIVFTGAPGDGAVVSAALRAMPGAVDAIDLTGRADLLALAAVIERCAVFVTGDTGPMHIAAAVGTPLVAIFGPSDPARWGPLARNAQIVHSSVQCRPCNQIRKPPSRCMGHEPDCLAAVSVEAVVSAVDRQLATAAAAERSGHVG
jgi:lipopolysaccharide heptosyltransferase II